MRAVILGDGLLGSYLRDKTQWDFISRKKDGIDFSNLDSYSSKLEEYDVVVNCIANTDTYSEDRNLHWEINYEGVANLIDFCNSSNKKIIHISTDYVFDVNSSSPDQTTDTPNPASVYGKSKLDGENYVRTILPSNSWVIRTAWLYSPYGKNFAKTILRNAKKGSELTVVDDSWGQPTNARSLAFQICELLNSDAPAGIYHGTNSGQTTWFGFAKKLLRESSLQTSLEPRQSEKLEGVAPRPNWSVLNTSKWESVGLRPMPNWEDELQKSIPELLAAIYLEEA
jgi:dTDP-4-dehydrorhamnose reductase